MAAALGVRFLDADGRDLPFGGVACATWIGSSRATWPNA